MRKLNAMILGAALSVGLFAGSVFGQTPATAPQTQTKSKADKAAKTTETAAMPTAQEISDAKAKGMVWANTNTKVYHKDDKYYGKTKHGKFMTEADAQKAGYHEAKEGVKKTVTTKPAKPEAGKK
jgi:hypothetical protein